MTTYRVEVSRYSTYPHWKPLATYDAQAEAEMTALDLWVAELDVRAWRITDSAGYQVSAGPIKVLRSEG